MSKHRKVAKQIAETAEPVEIQEKKVVELLKQNYPAWKRLWWLWFLVGFLAMWLVSGVLFTNLLDSLFEGLFGIL